MAPNVCQAIRIIRELGLGTVDHVSFNFPWRIIAYSKRNRRLGSPHFVLFIFVLFIYLLIHLFMLFGVLYLFMVFILLIIKSTHVKDDVLMTFAQNLSLFIQIKYK